MTGRFCFAVIALTGLLLTAATLAIANQAAPEEFFDAIDHPAIDYRSMAPTDDVAQLARRLAEGTETLDYDEQTGYIPALLRALDIPVASQLAVFSRTSLQPIVSPQNPRAIYFNDSVVVAWPRGGFIEIAAQDPRQGVIFYAMPQQRAGRPFPIRRNDCLQCHYSYATGGVPGLLVRSVITGPRGEAMPFLGNYLTDDRSPLEERWAGWFVSGSTGQGRHLGNQQPAATRDTTVQIPARATAVRSFPEALRGYPSQQSDVVAHLVFDHQVRLINLLTRSAWQVRLADAEKRDVGMVASRVARELVDALLFVDEAGLPAGLSGGVEFMTAFTARGPADRKSRSLREFNLQSRLMRYPCSFMIYSDAFDALPVPARDAVYRRLWSVLAGTEKDARYARLTSNDRRAIVEILRDTKKDLPEYWR